jgi:succinate dehydrogenase hydrophobic anchor subunit
MTTRFQEIFKARLHLTHFLLSLLTGLVLLPFLYFFLIPLTYWFIYGEGEVAAKVVEQPANVFLQDWGALIIAVFFYFIGLFNALRFSRPSKAKSYALVGLILIVIYPFRREIGDFLFDFLQ